MAGARAAVSVETIPAHSVENEPGKFSQLRSLHDRLDIKEAEEIYLPASRLPSIYVDAAHRLDAEVAALSEAANVADGAGLSPIGMACTPVSLWTCSVWRRKNLPQLLCVTLRTWLHAGSSRNRYLVPPCSFASAARAIGSTLKTAPWTWQPLQPLCLNARNGPEQ